MRKSTKFGRGSSLKPSLQDRNLISMQQAMELTNLFKVLANDTRIRLLHILVKSEEHCVSDLANAVSMKPQAISNQLQRLVDQKIVSFRRIGNQIYYHILDPCVKKLLEHGLCLIEDRDYRIDYNQDLRGQKSPKAKK